MIPGGNIHKEFLMIYFRKMLENVRGRIMRS